MFPKTGKDFPSTEHVAYSTYAAAISEALRMELGDSHRATKTLMRWTGASDRTAKNWLSGCFAPRGDHLIELARQSDVVLATILSLAGRNQHLVGRDLLAIRRALTSATELVESLLLHEFEPG